MSNTFHIIFFEIKHKFMIIEFNSGHSSTSIKNTSFSKGPLSSSAHSVFCFEIATLKKKKTKICYVTRLASKLSGQICRLPLKKFAITL